MTTFHGDEDILQVLRVSFLMEKGMREFYLKASKTTSYESATKTFEMLGRVEQKHMQNIYDLYVGLTEEKALSLDDFSSRMKSDVMEGGIQLLEGLRRASELDFTNMKDVLECALDREKDSYEFYRDNAQAAKDASAKVLFEELAENEEGHIRLIEKELSALATHLYR